MWITLVSAEDERNSCTLSTALTECASLRRRIYWVVKIRTRNGDVSPRKWIRTMNKELNPPSFMIRSYCMSVRQIGGQESLSVSREWSWQSRGLHRLHSSVRRLISTFQMVIGGWPYYYHWRWLIQRTNFDLLLKNAIVFVTDVGLAIAFEFQL